MIELTDYSVTGHSITRKLEIIFPDLLDVEMPAPYSGAIYTYRIHKLIVLYVNDAKPHWTMVTAKVLRSGETSKATVEFSSFSIEHDELRDLGHRLSQIEDPWPTVEPGRFGRFGS